MNVELLKKRANKHKKFLENKVLINPYGYEINNNKYYLVIYERGEKLKGYTIISEDDYNKEDALKAFDKLILFTAYVNRFFEVEESKMKLPPDSLRNIYVVVDNYLDSNQNEHLENGRKAFSKLESLLRELQQKLNSYTQHYDNEVLVRNDLNEKEMDLIVETLAHVNILQYQQGKTLIDSFETIKKLYAEMKNLNLLIKLSDYDQKIIKELANNITDTKQSIQDFSQEQEIAHLPIEQQIKEIVMELREIGRNKLARYRQDLRYPKP
jgi:hypothetical protein